jgi:hypothetical protein
MFVLASVVGWANQLRADGSIDVVVDIPSTVMVVLALAASLVAAAFAMRFARTVGGEMGAAFKFVNAGVAVFALTRIDDVLKVSGMWAKWGIDYKRTLWAPHSGVVFLAWVLIAYGLYRMSKAFAV